VGFLDGVSLGRWPLDPVADADPLSLVADAAGR